MTRNKFKTITILLLIIICFNIFSVQVYAFNTDLTSALFQNGVGIPLQNNALEFNAQNLMLENSLYITSTLPNDILSLNSNILNTNVLNTQTEQIYEIPMAMMDDMNNNLNDLNKLMEDMQNLEKDKKIIIYGSLYEYRDTSFNKKNDINKEDSISVSTEENTETIEKDSETIETEEQTTDIDNMEQTENISSNQTDFSQENNESKVEENEEILEDNKETKKETTIEYYTIVNKNEYIQLVPGNKELEEFFKLVANKDYEFEFICKKDENNIFTVNYVTCLTELSEEILEEFEEKKDKLNSIISKKGLFVTIEEKVYFLEDKTNKIHSIATEEDAIEELIFFLTDEGIKTKINVNEYNDFIDIYYLEILEEKDLSEEDVNEIKIIINFNKSKVYNFTSPIFSTQDNLIYYVKVENKEFILNTFNINIGDKIVELANKNQPVYMEGYLSREENNNNIYVTYISSEKE